MTTKLADYLRDQGVTQVQFAALADLDQSTISRLCRGTMTASLPAALKIEAATRGAVPVSALLKLSAASA
jgi:transcriptional regulator with XRE-family HTH domain